MPECDDATLTKLENSIQGLMSVTEMLDKGDERRRNAEICYAWV